MRAITAITLIIVTITFSGCGGTAVTGTVTFPDGEPLTKGKAVFQDSRHTYTAAIGSSGTFSMGVLREGSGIPAGEYRVTVADAFDEEFVSPDLPPVLHPLVAPKYTSVKTSGIICNVRKKTVINIVVEKPKPIKN